MAAKYKNELKVNNLEELPCRLTFFEASGLAKNKLTGTEKALLVSPTWKIGKKEDNPQDWSLLSDLGGKASKCGLSFAASVEASFILVSRLVAKYVQFFPLLSNSCRRVTKEDSFSRMNIHVLCQNKNKRHQYSFEKLFHYSCWKVRMDPSAW